MPADLVGRADAKPSAVGALFKACHSEADSVSALSRPVHSRQDLEMPSGVGRTLEDVRRHPTLKQRIAQLGA